MRREKDSMKQSLQGQSRNNSHKQRPTRAGQIQLHLRTLLFSVMPLNNCRPQELTGVAIKFAEYQCFSIWTFINYFMRCYQCPVQSKIIAANANISSHIIKNPQIFANSAWRSISCNGARFALPRLRIPPIRVTFTAEKSALSTCIDGFKAHCPRAQSPLETAPAMSGTVQRNCLRG